jgi:hypothetical protein
MLPEAASQKGAVNPQPSFAILQRARERESDMNFQQAIASGFQNYATFTGRAARSEYWYWVLFAILVGAAAGILDAAFFPGLHALGRYTASPRWRCSCRAWPYLIRVASTTSIAQAGGC